MGYYTKPKWVPEEGDYVVINKSGFYTEKGYIAVGHTPLIALVTKDVDEDHIHDDYEVQIQLGDINLSMEYEYIRSAKETMDDAFVHLNYEKSIEAYKTAQKTEEDKKATAEKAQLKRLIAKYGVPE